MLNIIFLILAGVGLVFVSKYNWVGVPLDLGFYRIANIPLFYVMAGSLLVGLTFSYVMQLLQNIANAWVLRGKSREIKESKEEVLELTKRVHELELEKASPIDGKAL